MIYHFFTDVITELSVIAVKIKFISHLKMTTTILIKNYLNLISDKVNALKQKNNLERISAIDNEIKQLENKILIEYTNYRSNTISKKEFISRREKLSNKIYVINLEKEKINSDSDLPGNITDIENIIEKFNFAESVTDEAIQHISKKDFYCF